VPPKTKEKGRVANSYYPPTSGTKNAGKPSASEGGQKGGPRGVSPLAGGLGGVPSDLTPWPLSLRGKGENWQRQGRGRANPVTSGAQNSENPKPTRVGKWGWRGLRPLPGGLGDVPPKTKEKGRVANSYYPPTSGTKNAGEPSAHEGGQRGVQGGASPPGGGCGGCPPHKTLKGGE